MCQVFEKAFAREQKKGRSVGSEREYLPEETSAKSSYFSLKTDKRFLFEARACIIETVRLEMRATTEGMCECYLATPTEKEYALKNPYCSPFSLSPKNA